MFDIDRKKTKEVIFWRKLRSISFLPPIQLAHLLGPMLRLPEKGNCVLVGRSREIVDGMVECLGLRPGDVILAPASICWVALAPLLAKGVRVRCYPLDPQLNIDTGALKKMVCNRTKAVYIVHYFGCPQQDVQSLKTWCHQNGLKLVEDCALCLFDCKGTIGQLGDVSFFSLWKYLPMPDGAIALAGNGVEFPHPSVTSNTKWVTKGILRILACSLPSGGIVSTVRKFYPSIPSGLAYEAPGPTELLKLTSMSAISRHIFARCDIESVAEARRSNYSLLVDGIKNLNGILPIWKDFPENSVPFALPLRVSDPVSLKQDLALKGIETEISINSFIRNHPQIEGNPEDFKIIDEMSEHVLSLPVHQGMTQTDIEYLISSLYELF
jgi:perosamine synthetase